MATFYPSSGSIDIGSVNTLFGRGDSISNYTGTTYYTSTGGPFTFPSSNFGFNAFYGTGPNPNRVALSYTFTSSTANASLNVTSIGGYSAGHSDITVTVNSGVYLYATSTGSSGLALSGGTSGDTLTLVNNGYIMGQGGGPANANPGGPALSLGYNTTVNNTNGSAYIGGGGGSGGTFNYCGAPCVYNASGGGAGGGGGGPAGVSNPAGTGGAGGGIGATGGTGTSTATPRVRWVNATGGGAGGGGTVQAGGGGGGRIFPGTGGTAGSTSSRNLAGAGGASNSLGGNSPPGPLGGAGGGGGWGAKGGTGGGAVPFAGGNGGNAVTLNGHTVTWVSGCTARVWGAVS